MPLVTTEDMFKKAMEGHYAIGAFNINNMEFIQAITDAAEKCQSPVILQVSSSAIKYARMDYLIAMVNAAVKNTTIPIAKTITKIGYVIELFICCLVSLTSV